MTKGRGEESSAIGLEKTVAAAITPTPAGDGADLALDRTIATNLPTAAGGSSAEFVEGTGGALSRGANLGRYVVLDLLGRGGMGEVYTAYDPELDRRVALKVIHSMLRAAGDPASAKARLVREAQTLARLSHPNVVAVYDVGEIDGDIYVAMEFVEGKGLGAWLRAAERSTAEILEVFTAAASGLAAAHDSGLVHRDVKPDNILIGADGRVRLIDFGIARVGDDTDDAEKDELVVGLSSNLETGQLAETRAGSLLGTPAYMAPEQFAGCVADARSDQFSLCVALFEAVSGERPFEGKTLPELSDNVLENKRRELSAGSDVPAWLSAALERGLAPDPEGRYADMTALAAALVPPQPRTRTAAWILGGLVALLAAGGISYAIYGGASGDPCADVAAVVDEVWSEDRRDAIEESFRRVNPTLAQDAASRTIVRLNGYAKGWATARVQTCRETAIGELSKSTGERKLACLGSRLSELRAVVSVLANADSALVENAVQTTSALSSIDSCSNLSRLLGAPEIPAEIDLALATIKALERGGSYKQAEAEASRAIERASALGSDAGRARALVWRGRTESQLGKNTDAAESMFEAVRVAEQANDSFARAEAWTYLIFVTGLRLARHHDALRWSKHADIAIKADGAPLELESKRVYHTALVQHKLRRYEQALSEFRQAADLAEQAFGAGTFEVLLAQMGQAMTLRSLERVEEGVALYQQILAGMTEQLGEGNPRLAIVHSNLGLGLVALQRYAEGRAQYERAVALKRAKLGDHHPSVLITLANLATLEEKLGNYEEAERQMLAVHNARVESIGPTYRQLGSSMMARARVAAKRGDLAAASALQREAIVVYTTRGPDARESTAIARATLCDIMRQQRRLSAAARECAAALATLRDDVEDPRNLATALTLAAHVELDAGTPVRALELAREAQKIRGEHPSNKRNTVHTHFVVAAALGTDLARRSEALREARLVEKEIATLHVGDRVLAEATGALIGRLESP